MTWTWFIIPHIEKIEHIPRVFWQNLNGVLAQQKDARNVLNILLFYFDKLWLISEEEHLFFRTHKLTKLSCTGHWAGGTLTDFRKAWYTSIKRTKDRNDPCSEIRNRLSVDQVKVNKQHVTWTMHFYGDKSSAFHWGSPRARNDRFCFAAVRFYRKARPTKIDCTRLCPRIPPPPSNTTSETPAFEQLLFRQSIWADLVRIVFTPKYFVIFARCWPCATQCYQGIPAFFTTCSDANFETSECISHNHSLRNSHSKAAIKTIIATPVKRATISLTDCHSFVSSNSSGITDTVAM